MESRARGTTLQALITLLTLLYGITFTGEQGMRHNPYAGGFEAYNAGECLPTHLYYIFLLHVGRVMSHMEKETERGGGGAERRDRDTDRDTETCCRLLQRRYFCTSKSRELEALSPCAAVEEPCLDWIRLD